MAPRAFLLVALLALGVSVPPAAADATPQPLPFAQAWSDVAMIAHEDDWSSVRGVIGYRGDDLATGEAADPQAVVADGSATPVDVIANRTNPAAVFAGGVAEFELADPVAALRGSVTADAPQLVFALRTTGRESVRVAYTLRDIDASAANAVQPVALQYRVGASGPYVNLPAAFVADATIGPSDASRVTAAAAVLPPDASDRPLVQVRVLTANAAGADEWVGIDDMRVSGTPIAGPDPGPDPDPAPEPDPDPEPGPAPDPDPAPEPGPSRPDTTPPTLSATVAARLRLGRALRHGVRATVELDEPAAIRVRLRIRPCLARRVRVPRVVGAATFELSAGRARVVTRFRVPARRKLARLSRVKLTLTFAAVDAAGNRSTASARTMLAR